MDYVFNIERSEAKEIHEILGFVDADFSTAQLLPYIRKSTKQIIKYIGKANYDKAVSVYDPDEDPEDEFLVLVRYAIALGAFREYAPLTDLSFTTNGRVFRSEDHTKAAFEWMLDKSDAAMERSYYSAINEIFEFIIGDDEYEETPLIIKIKNLYVASLDRFEDYVKIDNSYVLFFNLIPSLILAEKRLIKPRVGEIDITGNEYILHLIQNICVYFAMIDGMRKNSVQLFPRGVLKESTGNTKQTAAKQFDIEASVLHYIEENKKLLDDLELNIKKLSGSHDIDRIINFEPKDGFVTL